MSSRIPEETDYQRYSLQDGRLPEIEPQSPFLDTYRVEEHSPPMPVYDSQPLLQDAAIYAPPAMRQDTFHSLMDSSYPQDTVYSPMTHDPAPVESLYSSMSHNNLMEQDTHLPQEIEQNNVYSPPSMPSPFDSYEEKVPPAPMSFPKIPAHQPRRYKTSKFFAPTLAYLTILCVHSETSQVD
jgi:hypothetical protein